MGSMEIYHISATRFLNACISGSELLGSFFFGAVIINLLLVFKKENEKEND